MRVVLLLRELMEQENWGPADLERHTGIKARQLRKLLSRDQSWELSKEKLYRLMLVAFEHGFPHGIFAIRQNDVWNSFMKQPASICRVASMADSAVEDQMRNFLSDLQCKPEILQPQDKPNIGRLVRGQNCVFIGSPKANSLTEEALARLFGAKAFDTSEANRKLFPFQFLGDSDEHRSSKSALLASSTSPAIHLRELDGRKSRRLKVDHWRSEQDFKGRSGIYSDAAIIVVCRRSTADDQKVTTIVIAGYTGLSTQEAAAQLIFGDPPFSDADLEDGVPVGASYEFRFRKLAFRGQASLTKLKRPLPGEGKWKRFL